MKSKVGILLICMYGVLSYGHSFVKQMQSMYYPAEYKNDKPWSDMFIDRYEDHLKEVKILLPDTRFIGFTSDTEYDDEWWRVFILTQYMLLPIIVVDDNGSLPIVIGSFKNNNINIEILKAKNLQKWKDFENGIILFRRVKEKT